MTYRLFRCLSQTLCIFFLIDVVFSNVTDSKSTVISGNKYHVQKLSSCGVDISNYGIINLKPLEKTDGLPR